MPAEILVEETESALAESLEEAATLLLGLLARDDDELTVLLCDDARIRKLNREYRGRDAATDVLSFPQLDGDAGVVGAAGGQELLGDVVISVDAVERQARDGGWSQAEEAARLLLHGLLHLLGYDHERSRGEALRMQAEERRLAAALCEAGLPCAMEPDASGTAVQDKSRGQKSLQDESMGRRADKADEAQS